MEIKLDNDYSENDVLKMNDISFAKMIGDKLLLSFPDSISKKIPLFKVKTFQISFNRQLITDMGIRSRPQFTSQALSSLGDLIIKYLNEELEDLGKKEDHISDITPSCNYVGRINWSQLDKNKKKTTRKNFEYYNIQVYMRRKIPDYKTLNGEDEL